MNDRRNGQPTKMNWCIRDTYFPQWDYDLDRIITYKHTINLNITIHPPTEHICAGIIRRAVHDPKSNKVLAIFLILYIFSSTLPICIPPNVSLRLLSFPLRIFICVSIAVKINIREESHTGLVDVRHNRHPLRPFIRSD
jgi:hypothetical protein